MVWTTAVILYIAVNDISVAQIIVAYVFVEALELIILVNITANMLS